MHDLIAVSDKIIELSGSLPTDEVTALHEVSRLIHEICIIIHQKILDGHSKEDVVSCLNKLRELHKKSTFISRLQEWPRGYQGDFETIEYLCDGINKTKPKTIEHYLERIALSSPIAQQHKNKIIWQSNKILSTIFNNPQSPTKILSIGCGGCRDLRLIAPALKLANTQFIINDIDEDALRFAEKNLKEIQDKIIPINGDAFRKTREFSKYAKFDLIVAGGLFDYLPDKYASSLIKKLSQSLSPTGKICFTNILKPNPWSVWVEFLSNWTLIERTKLDYEEMFNNYGLSDMRLSMQIDRTGLAGLYELSYSS